MQAFCGMRKASRSKEAPRRRWGSVGFGLPLLVLGLAVGSAVAERRLGIEGPYSAVVLAAFCAGAALVLWLAALHLGNRAFGAANLVTSLRGALAALLGGLLLARPGAAVAWFAVAVTVPSLVLDGVDGALARRRGLASPFGARFDMEIDALTILILSALAWRFDRAGAWVLLSGLARYVFVAAAMLWPWLGRPLPPSRRRQAACVVQAATLVACVAPVVPAAAAAGIAALGLAGLIASFSLDVVGLWRASGAHAAPGGAPPPGDGTASGALTP